MITDKDPSADDGDDADEMTTDTDKDWPLMDADGADANAPAQTEGMASLVEAPRRFGKPSSLTKGGNSRSTDPRRRKGTRSGKGWSTASTASKAR